MKGADGIERILDLVDVSGHDDEHDAYRSEVVRLYSLVKIVQLLKKIGGNIGGHLEVGCDGLSALNKCFLDNPQDISSSQAHFDLISGVHGIKRAMDVTWQWQHIYGHQEDISGRTLDVWALLNIEFD